MKRLLGLLLLVALPVLGQVPTGEFIYEFTDLPLWDVSGAYRRVANNSTITATLQQHVSGLLTGTRTEIYDLNGDHAEGSAFISGKTFSKPPLFGYQSRWEGNYSGVFNGNAVVFSASVKGSAIVVPSTLTLVSEANGQICYVVPPDVPCVEINDGSELPLPDGMTGDWTLTLNLTASGTDLAGTATLTLSNGRTLSYQITGRYDSTKQTAKLGLAGYGEATGSKFSLTTLGQELNLLAIKGRVLGQKIKFPL